MIIEWMICFNHSLQYLVGGLDHVLFSQILGMSSSQLTKSYFSEGWNHQPDDVWWLIMLLLMILWSSMIYICMMIDYGMLKLWWIVESSNLLLFVEQILTSQVGVYLRFRNSLCTLWEIHTSHDNNLKYVRSPFLIVKSTHRKNPKCDGWRFL